MLASIFDILFSSLGASRFIVPYFPTYNPSDPQHILKPLLAYYIFLPPYHYGESNMKLFWNGLVITQPLFECQICARQCDSTV